MSKLYYSERGSVVPYLCEELTDYRRARKILTLPATGKGGILYLLARSSSQSNTPLQVSANGTMLAKIDPAAEDYYRWYTVVLPAELLRDGENSFELWCDSPIMGCWSLAIEGGYENPESFVSTDFGDTWRDWGLGYLNSMRGEYVVRVRVPEGKDPDPPPFVWEDPGQARLKRITNLIPESILTLRDNFETTRRILSWVNLQFDLSRTDQATLYAPWDPETIIAWGRSGQGHYGRKAVAMCVHYSIVATLFFLAAGLRARPAVITRGLNTTDGHFMVEVWLDEYHKWIVVDPTLDALFMRNDTPLSVSEIQAEGENVGRLVSWGPSHETHPTLPEDWIHGVFLNGECFKHRSIWGRNDFLSHPEHTPAGHGSTCYCETDLIWEAKDLEEGFAAFPYFGHSGYFDAPPEFE